MGLTDQLAMSTGPMPTSGRKGSSWFVVFINYPELFLCHNNCGGPLILNFGGNINHGKGPQKG